MSIPTQIPTLDIAASDIKALEALVTSEDLARLAKIAGTVRPFNFFDVASLRRREEVHTRLLGFLLDPQREHGFGDAFVRLFTARTLGQDHAWRGQSISVCREWPCEVEGERGRVDLLLVDLATSRVLIIENKVDSDEYGGQLGKYWAAVGAAYQRFNIQGLFLTIRGKQASHGQYRAADYTVVCDVCEELLAGKHGDLLPETRDLLDHYAQLLRRDVVGESEEVIELCERIFVQNRRAVELLIKNQPIPDAQVVQLMHRLVRAEEQLQELSEHTSDTEICFVPRDWVAARSLKARQARYSQWALLFGVDRLPQVPNVAVRLYVDRSAGQQVQQLVDLAQSNGQPFQPREYVNDWVILYEHILLASQEYAYPRAERETLAQKRWGEFLRHDLPLIRDFFSASAAKQNE